jgi:hypothetical protein
MKTKAKTSAVKSSRVVKSALRVAPAKKKSAWSGFAPELCGVMEGPKDLSTRKGFPRG